MAIVVAGRAIHPILLCQILQRDFNFILLIYLASECLSNEAELVEVNVRVLLAQLPNLLQTLIVEWCLSRGKGSAILCGGVQSHEFNAEAAQF